ncbi:sulfotransferase [Candidatus Binatia bacterium]|nr:sulfotransferase [Candidatus Binatia bacterium]
MTTGATATPAADTRRNVIRIDDLRAPRRSPQQQAAYDYGRTLQVDLDPDRLMKEAAQRTGLADFGDPMLRDRLAAQCRATDADTGLSGLGRLGVRQRLLALLSARLRFEDYVRRHPEALDVRLEPPVIVVGLPRSGTTHLVNLLAADSRFRALPWWECQEPTPFPGDGPGRDGVDPRYLRALAIYELQSASAPELAAMHDRHPSVIEEDCELVDLDLCSYTLEWYARVPLWRDHYLALDQDAHYAFLRRELQVLSHLRGPRRWVLKTPQHLEQLGPLLRTFPDATIALTLRDPVAVLQSAITMLGWGERMRRVEVDADGLAAYWLDRIERLLRASVRDLHLIPAERRVDVEFGAFMADELGTVTRILDAAGLGVPDETRKQLEGYVAGNPRGKNGRMIYDLRGDFGLDPHRVRERFSFYFEVFPQIRAEVA